jgi:DNA-binding NarL/FixJ family response regulator
VDAPAALDDGVPPSRDARRLRIAVVSAVRFTREVLEEILERDPLMSVVRLCADLAELAAMSPSLETDLVLFDTRVPDVSPRSGAPLILRRPCASSRSR